MNIKLEDKEELLELKTLDDLLEYAELVMRGHTSTDEEFIKYSSMVDKIHRTLKLTNRRQ